MNKSALSGLVEEANRRFLNDLKAALPKTSRRLDTWRRLSTLAAEGLEYRSFPLFYLPFWIAPEDAPQRDRSFHVDLLYASLNGFSFIRLIDDVADDDQPPNARKLLPLAGYFHSRFQETYHRYFAGDHEFWKYFHRYWSEQAECSAEDQFLEHIDEAAFAAIPSRKTSAAKIPLAAAALRYGRWDGFERWSEFVHRLGMLQQMSNDLLGWENDHRHGLVTYFLSTFRERRRPGESAASWIAREGFDWGKAVVLGLVSRLFDEASELGSPPAVAWVAARKDVLERQLALMAATLRLTAAWAGGARLSDPRPAPDA